MGRARAPIPLEEITRLARRQSSSDNEEPTRRSRAPWSQSRLEPGRRPMARMRVDALATLLQISDSHHCLSLMAAPRSMKFRVAVQVQPGKSGHARITSVLSRPMEANPVTRLRRKELMALASPGKTPSSERQRFCRQRLGKTSGSGCKLGRGCFF